MWATRLDVNSSSKCQLKTQLDDQSNENWLLYQSHWTTEQVSSEDSQQMHRD